MIDLFDTVAAVSTPRGKGGIAVIRISGKDAREILARVFRPVSAHPTQNPRKACLGGILDGEGSEIDRGLATLFPAPASFTGEDVVELSCHGGILLTQKVLEAVFAAGARPAEAGEFTRRALLNGKMKLSSAEALGELLEAQTADQLTLARGGMKGNLTRKIDAAFTALSALLADAYAKIDFPDEDLNSMDRPALMLALQGVREELAALLATYRTGHAVAEGVRTVICGPVNAGKSTLYNAIVGREAAIVTDVAGTTRDLLCETASLGGVTLRLVDTAGLRATDDVVEGIGVARSREAMREAELVLAVFDATKEPDEETLAFVKQLSELSATVLTVLNKTDGEERFPASLLPTQPVRIAAARGEIGALERELERLFLCEGLSLSQDPIVANARQYAALSKAAEALDTALCSLKDEVPLDAALIDAELAMQYLGEVDGRAVDEAIIADIFSHFCVGK